MPKNNVDSLLGFILTLKRPMVKNVVKKPNIYLHYYPRMHKQKAISSLKIIRLFHTFGIQGIVLSPLGFKEGLNLADSSVSNFIEIKALSCNALQRCIIHY